MGTFFIKKLSLWGAKLDYLSRVFAMSNVGTDKFITFVKKLTVN